MASSATVAAALFDSHWHVMIQYNSQARSHCDANIGSVSSDCVTSGQRPKVAATPRSSSACSRSGYECADIHCGVDLEAVVVVTTASKLFDD